MSERLRISMMRLRVAVKPYIPLPGEWYRKVQVDDSENRYETGRWGYMRDIAEAHRYSIIIGCCDYYKDPATRTVLDVGCGEGILHRRTACADYVGIDMNAEAIRQAESQRVGRARFIHGAAEDYRTRDRYDVIVLNESLYYIRNPVDIFNLYRSFLVPDGILVVCMFQTNLSRRIWARLEKCGMEELTAVKVSNDLGYSSIIKVFANSLLSPRS